MLLQNKRYFIYCDESGEVSFSTKSACKYFSICALTVSEEQKVKIKNTMKRKRAKLLNLGWPKGIEVKASILHSMRNNKDIPQKVKENVNGDQFIEEVIMSLKNACAPRIDYIIIRKDGITNPSFRNAPYGIAYNFFAGKILIPLVLDYRNCTVTVDMRNKETHSQKHFDGYIETVVYEQALEKQINIDMQIAHIESRSDYGLQAVDFFSWGIYRKIVSNDLRFYRIFADLVCMNKEWY